MMKVLLLVVATTVLALVTAKDCVCISTSYSDSECMHMVGNATTTTVQGGVCKNIPGGGSEKTASDCRSGAVYKESDCKGAPMYTMAANGRCNQIGSFAAYYKATCGATQLTTTALLGVAVVALSFF
eukprot:TRINITY_DN67996_c7_g6_i1.p1 TRINITY_DN67996_c7_g6~~TRINITY_DN67996_c7_g6_i1.p1  ORF type:complete len:127 (-),score=17.94 TRINITY_DN67996_c7_g6_i1:282-662(-)